MYLSIANRVKIGSLGGIEAIIKAMSGHKDHSGLQEIACGALRVLSENEGISAPRVFFFRCVPFSSSGADLFS